MKGPFGRATVGSLLRSSQTCALAFAILLAASVGAVACSGDDDPEATPTAEETTASDGTTEQTTSEATTEETTTEAGPPPITASEQRWTREMNQIRRQMTRGLTQTRVYTNSVMTKLAKTYSTCVRSLRRAGDPGRFAPAARIAERACKRADRAGSLMEQALALEAAGILSQADADRYSSWIEGAIEAQGNAVNDFAQASVRARTIQEELTG